MPPLQRIEDVDAVQRLQLLVDGVVDYAIYLISVEGTVLTWNSGAERLKGYRADEILGKPFATFFTPEDRSIDVPGKALAAAATTGRFESEGWRVRKDGNRFWALGVIDAVRDSDGRLIGFAKVTRDMTERRHAQQKLEESELRFRRLVDAVVDYAIFQLDKTGRVTSWNTGAERIKGYTADEIIGHHFRQFYLFEDRAAGVPERALEVAAREGKFEAEGWRLRKDGTRFCAFVVIDPIRDETGELIGFAKVTRDITERMEAQRALKATQDQLAASQKMEAIGQLSGHGIPRINCEVEKRRLQMVWVDLDLPQPSPANKFHLDPFAKGALQKFGGGVEKTRDVYRFGIERLTSGESQKATCKSGCALGPTHRIVKRALEVRRAGKIPGTAHSRFKIADDDHH